MTELTPAQRRELRATAHHLQPVVTIAGNGLTPAVTEEIERSLQAHELIKIKVHGTERTQRNALMNEVCITLGAAPVQHIGTILVVWRKRREEDGPTPAPKADRLVGDKRPSKTKSARAFSAAARRTALVQAAAAKKRRSPRAPRGDARKPSGRDD